MASRAHSPNSPNSSPPTSLSIFAQRTLIQTIQDQLLKALVDPFNPTLGVQLMANLFDLPESLYGGLIQLDVLRWRTHIGEAEWDSLMDKALQFRQRRTQSLQHPRHLRHSERNRYA
jgi:hypothetical protein